MPRFFMTTEINWEMGVTGSEEWRPEDHRELQPEPGGRQGSGTCPAPAAWCLGEALAILEGEGFAPLGPLSSSSSVF